MMMASNRVVVGEQIAVLKEAGAEVQQMHDDPGTFHVAKKLMTQTRSLAGPSDEARNIGHDESNMIRFHYAQRWSQRGKGIGGHLWVRR